MIEMKMGDEDPGYLLHRKAHAAHVVDGAAAAIEDEFFVTNFYEIAGTAAVG